MSDLKFSNDYCDLRLGNDGLVRGLMERGAGREWQDPSFRVPLFGAVHSGVALAPTRVDAENGLFHLRFEQIGFACSVRIRPCQEHFLIEVDAISGPPPEVLTFFGIALSPASAEGEIHRGAGLNTIWDNRFSMTLLSLNERTDADSIDGRIFRARADARFGLQQASCALLTVPTHRLDRALVELAGRYGLPTPTLGGQPAKLSPTIRRGYLFTDLDSESAGQVLEWTRRGGFGHILLYAGVWHDRFGHYRVHPERFPGGTATFRAIVDRFHQAGIGVGIHFGSANIGWEDPYMTPVPDRRLAVGARFRLARPVGAEDRWLETNAHPLMAVRRTLFEYQRFGANWAALGSSESDRLDPVAVDLDTAPCVARLDDELIRMRHNLAGMGFEALERGMYGTRPSSHAEGTEIVVLRQLFGSFLMDVYSTLLDEVAESVAAIYNQCQLDMIYFDCGEGYAGPAWNARARLHSAFLRRFHRECLVQGSDYPHHSWHWCSRGGTSDAVPTCADAHTDHTRVPRARTCLDNRMPADLGWFPLYANSPEHHATRPAEVAHLCRRAAELGASISIQTKIAELRNNPDTGAILDVVGRHERTL